jgi:hypothetical protein
MVFLETTLMNKINVIGPAVLSLDVEIKACHTLNSTHSGSKQAIRPGFTRNGATNCGQQDNSIQAQSKALMNKALGMVYIGTERGQNIDSRPSINHSAQA